MAVILEALLERLRQALAGPPDASLPTPPRQSFFVIGEASGRRGTLQTKDIVTAGFSYPASQVRVYEGPETISDGDASKITLLVAVGAACGPGDVGRGDIVDLRNGEGRYIGSISVRDVVPIGADPHDRESWVAAWRQVLDVEPSPDGHGTCPTCGQSFSLGDRREWSGVRHHLCGQKLNLVGVTDQVKPIWCLIANVVSRRPALQGQPDTLAGTKQFAPGTKVYCFPPLWGVGYERVTVLGKPRRKSGLIKIVIPSARLENFRVKMVYSPSVIDRFAGAWDGSDESRKLANALSELMARRGEASSSPR